jgi:photosystem II stability/assembly factor-like uncharacterized protein
MNDDELLEVLRRTLRNRAQALKPTTHISSAPAGRDHSARRALSPQRRPSRRTTLTAIGAASLAAAAAIALAVGLAPSHPTGLRLGSSSTIKTSTPPTSPAPSRTTPSTTRTGAIGSVPAGFYPLSATFISADTGWALGAAPCGSVRCATVARTSDGGVSWSAAPAPQAQLQANQGTGASIRFANLSDGWIIMAANEQSGNLGSLLWSTHDGGKTWNSVANPGGVQASILSLEASHGVTSMVVLTPGAGADRIFTTPSSADDWRPAPAEPSHGGGNTPTSQIVLFGASGWMLTVNKVVTGGAMLSQGGTWDPWTPPCEQANGPAALAAASPSNLVALCDEGIWGTPEAGTTVGSTWLYTSSNAGKTFTRVSRLPGTNAGGVTTPAAAASTIVASDSAGIVATFDGGQTWSTVHPTTSDVVYIGFTTETQGLAIEQSTGSGAQMLMTRDGGHSWAPVSF